MHHHEPHPVFPASEARHALRLCMEYLSEEHWCAGWLTDLEFTLWDWVLDWRAEPQPLHEAGSMDSQLHEARTLSWLAEQAGGWWVWEEGRQFVPMGEWLARFAARGQDVREAG